MNESVAFRYSKVRKLANSIVYKIKDELATQGFDNTVFNVDSADDAGYSLEKDPYDGQYSLKGEWLDERNGKLGSLLFHADGSFFVECDIIRPHPKKPKWFVEAINAWGKDESIKIDFKLLPMLD